MQKLTILKIKIEAVLKTIAREDDISIEVVEETLMALSEAFDSTLNPR